MPPRIPQIQPEAAGVSLPPQPSLDPRGLAELTTRGSRAVAEQLGSVAKQAEYAYAEQQRIQKILTREQDALAAEQAVNQFKLSSSTASTALKADLSVPAYSYAERMADHHRKERARIGKGLTSPGARLRFEREIDGVQTTMAINANAEGLKLQRDSIIAGHDRTMQTDEKAYALATDPKERERLAAQIDMRIDMLLGKEMFSGPEASARKIASEQRRERGAIEMDFSRGTGEQKNLLLSDLRAGRTRLPQTDALTLANTLEAHERSEAQRLKTEREAERKERAGTADRTVTDQLFANDFAGARTTLKAAQSDMEPTRYEHWTRAIEERERKGAVTVSDPVLMRKLIPLVYSTTVDPRVANNALLEGYANNKVADDDMRMLSGHLETKINRLATQANTAAVRADAAQRRQEATWRHDANNAEGMLKNLTKVDASLSPTLNLQAQDIYNDAVRDMFRNSPEYGGSEPPMQWIERNRPRIMGQVAQVGKARVANINKDLNFADRAAQADTPQGIDRGRQLLQQELAAARSPRERDAVMDRIRMLQEKENVLNELTRFGANTGPGGPRPTPAAGATPGSTPTGTTPTPSGPATPAPTGPRRAPGT